MPRVGESRRAGEAPRVGDARRVGKAPRVAEARRAREAPRVDETPRDDGTAATGGGIAVLTLLAASAAALPAGIAVAGPILGDGSQDALRSAGAQAGTVLDLWRLMLGVCAAVYVAVLAAVVVGLWRAPRAGVETLPSKPADERGLRRSVIAAVALSVVGLLVLMVASIGTDRALARLPAGADALRIEVTAHQWWWEARYDADPPSRMFIAANELHVPVGRPVVLTLRSADVIHSFWVPNLAGKKDLLPGHVATLRLRADRPGTYRGQCAEFCGLQHARMALVVVAEPVERYEAWARRQREVPGAPTHPQALRGREVFLGSSCVMCHRIAGTEASGVTGPDLSHVGGRATLGAGTLPNGTDALAQWIADPHRFKPGVRMPPHALGDADLQALAAYLAGLK